MRAESLVVCIICLSCMNQVMVYGHFLRIIVIIGWLVVLTIPVSFHLLRLRGPVCQLFKSVL